jgi:hypothetical protein
MPWVNEMTQHCGLKGRERPFNPKRSVRQTGCARGRRRKTRNELGDVVLARTRVQPSPQSVPHGLEAVVEVGFEIAGHEDVLEEEKNAIHVLGEAPD